MKALKPESWRRVETLLDHALDLAPESRPAFLDRACADDPQLRSQVEYLLRAAGETGGVLEVPLEA